LHDIQQAALTSFDAHSSNREGRPMQMVYFVCAIAGGTALLWQFGMTLLGGHADHGLGVDHDASGMGGDIHDVATHDGSSGDHDQQAVHESESSWFIGVLTLRTGIAAIAFFGFAGMAASTSGIEPLLTFAIAVGAGVAALYLVACMIRGLSQLRAEGTAHIRRSLGQAGTVYVPIPGARARTGKVMMNVQNRTMEYQAVTGQQELPTGTNVVVVGILGPDTVEVVQSSNSESACHVEFARTP